MPWLLPLPWLSSVCVGAASLLCRRRLRSWRVMIPSLPAHKQRPGRRRKVPAARPKIRPGAAGTPVRPASGLLLRHPGAALARLGQADRNRLLAALDLPAGAAALQRAGLALLHGAAD